MKTAARQPSSQARFRGSAWRLRLAVMTLALAGAASGALAGYEWSNVTGYTSPYLYDVEPGPETPPLTDQVVLVIVDGLRDDVARSLPTFRRVGAQGVRTVARATQPSLSLPGWTLITSGASPEISGITSNFYEGAVEVDSLFTSAERASVSTAIAGHRAWEQLYGEHVTAGYYGGGDDTRSDPAVGQEAIRLLEETDPGFLLVHLPDVDNVGHFQGVGRAYRSKARAADAIIAGILEAAGPEATVILTSDHGHVDQGGHGGPEGVVTRSPLAMAGPGIAEGVPIRLVSHADVAPTIAALLGLSRPTHATGEVLHPVLDADLSTRTAINDAHEEVMSRFDAAAPRALGEPGEATRSEARDALRRRDFLIRVPLALAGFALLLFVVVRASRGLDGGAMAVGVATFLAVWVAIFFGQGLTFSLSHFNTEDQIVPFLIIRLIEAVVAGLVGGAAAGFVAGRRSSPVPFRTGVTTAAWGMVVLAVPVAVFLALNGWGFTWRLPNLTFAFSQYLVLLGMLGLGATAGLVGLVAEGAARLAARGRAARA